MPLGSGLAAALGGAQVLVVAGKGLARVLRGGEVPGVDEAEAGVAAVQVEDGGFGDLVAGAGLLHGGVDGFARAQAEAAHLGGSQAQAVAVPPAQQLALDVHEWEHGKPKDNPWDKPSRGMRKLARPLASGL